MHKVITASDLICLVLLSAAILLFVKRFVSTVKSRNANNRKINFKWLGWYGDNAIIGTSSDWYKEYMQKYNKTTAAMWGCIFMAIIVYLLGKYYLS